MSWAKGAFGARARRQRERQREVDAIRARADEQQARWEAGDELAIYGDYPPTELLRMHRSRQENWSRVGRSSRSTRPRPASRLHQHYAPSGWGRNPGSQTAHCKSRAIDNLLG
jgi:hypothetical protein